MGLALSESGSSGTEHRPTALEKFRVNYRFCLTILCSRLSSFTQARSKKTFRTIYIILVKSDKILNCY